MAKPVYKELLDRQTAVTKIAGYLIAGFFGIALTVAYFHFWVRGALTIISFIFIFCCIIISNI